MMAPMTKKECGALGERLAGKHLESLGHIVLERNYRAGHLEVDLITKAKDGLHFVEVKSLVAPIAEDPTSKVDSAKRRRITSAALHYLNCEEVGSCLEVFFDIITVIFEGSTHTITYYPSAWIPMYT